MNYQDNDVIVTGAYGMLGRAVVKVLEASDYYQPVYKSGFDITNMTDIMEMTGAKIINCAGIVRGRDDINAKRMGQVNTLAPHFLATVAKRLIHVSTDCVFDGTKGPYVESDEPTPIDNYGMSKLMGEVGHVLALNVRTSFIGFGQHGLLRWVLNQPQDWVIEGFSNWLWNGLYVNNVARELVHLLDDPITGILHIEGPEISKFELLYKLTSAVRPDLSIDYIIHPEPKNMILKSERLVWDDVWGDAPDTTHSWDTMIKELKADYEAQS